MFVIALLAQVAAAPSSASAPAPTPTAAVGSASSSVAARPRTLADVARERKLGKKGVEGGTFSVAGASGAPASVAPREPHPAVRKGMSSEDTAAKRARLVQAQKDLADAHDSAARSAP
jgi:hypothetical protein